MDSFRYPHLIRFSVAVAALLSVLFFMLLNHPAASDLPTYIRTLALICTIGAWGIPGYCWYLNDIDEKPENDIQAHAETTQVAPAIVELPEQPSQNNVLALETQTQALHLRLKEINTQAQQAKQHAEISSQTLESITSASAQMSESVNEIASQAEQSRKIIEHSAVQSGNADSTSQSLETSASRIGTVVQLIQEIAEQINLLALNATIEAARAGDAGKGFAVVASEVKNLANQTAKATEEIGSQVEEIQAVSQDVVKTLSTIKEDIHHAAEHASAISAVIEAQKATALSLSEGLGKATNQGNETRQGIDALLSRSQTSESSQPEYREKVA